MAVYKEEKTGTWRVIYRYTDWTGARKQTQKRGFKTKREAQAWEREQLGKVTADLDMTFASFVEQYTADTQNCADSGVALTKGDVAVEKLIELLSDGPMPSEVIISRFKEMGISKRTVEDAKKKAGVKSRRIDKVWHWEIYDRKEGCNVAMLRKRRS